MNATLYTDTSTHDLTPYLTGLTLTHTLSAPYMRADLTLALDARLSPPYPLAETGAPNLDAWLVVRDQSGRALHLGPITAISESTGAGAEGTLSRRVRIAASSPQHTLERANLVLTARAVDAAGAYDLKAWGPRLRELIKAPFQANAVGAVLQRSYNVLAAPYRLPLTLADGASLTAIPTIYSTERARQYAPRRAADLRSVHGLAVQAVSQAASASGSPWGILSGAFDVEPSIIELFFALEPHTSGPVSEALGGSTPAFIYRVRPFVAGRVPSNAAASISATNEETREAAQTPHSIPAAQVISYQAQTTDGDRINAVYIESPFTASQGVESFGLTIAPSIDSADTRRAGLRLYKAKWPFFPSRQRGQSIKAHLQYVQDTAAAILGQAHRYSTASLSTAHRPDLSAGLWVNVELPHARLTGYIESLTHTLTIEPESGARVARSSLSLIRCFYDQV